MPINAIPSMRYALICNVQQYLQCDMRFCISHWRNCRKWHHWAFRIDGIAFVDMQLKNNQHGTGPALGTLLGPSWVVIGRCWGAIRSSWVVLGGSGGSLGALLGRSWELLGCSSAFLGRSWVLLGRSRGICCRLGSNLGSQASRLTLEAKSQKT